MKRAQFFIGLTAITMMLTGVGLAVILLADISGGLWIYLLTILFPALLSGIGYILMERSADKSGFAFQSALTGSMMLRMALSIGYIIGVKFLLEPNVFALVGYYFVAYFATSAFEVWALMYNLRRRKEQAERTPSSTPSEPAPSHTHDD